MLIRGLSAALSAATRIPVQGLANASITKVSWCAPAAVSTVQQRNFNIRHIDRPKPNDRKFDNYRFIVKYPKDGKYTTEHLPTQRLAGRHPISGRIVVGTWGGGRKTRYRWIDFNRTGPAEEGVYKEEKVLEIQYDPNRSPFIALVGAGSHLRYILATSTMCAGDIIRSSNFIPDIPGRGNPGDSFPMGALATGTEVCHVERYPGEGAIFLTAAGVSGKVGRRLEDGKVVLQMKKKVEIALDPLCNAVVGQLSNEDNNKVHIGSANRLRWLGYRPRSGLWQRKDGYCGRKIRAPPPMKFPKPPVKTYMELTLHCKGQGPTSRPVTAKTDRVS